MPKLQFPIGSIVETTFGKGLVVGRNPPSHSKMGRDRYHIYLYNLKLFDYPPACSRFKLLSPPTDATKDEVRQKILELLAIPQINAFKIGDIFTDHGLMQNIILDNGYKTQNGDIHHHIASYNPSTGYRYFLSYITEREILGLNTTVTLATPDSKQHAFSIIKEHMLEPIL